LFVALMTLGLFYLRHYLAVVMLTCATLAFLVGIKPSHNYWDYLVDPLLGLYCCVALLMLAARRPYRRLITLRGA
jgi:predicted membrane protein